MNEAELKGLIQEHFPIRAHDSMFELTCESVSIRDGKVVGVLRVIIFDMHDGQQMLRDIKEQEVAMGRAEHLEIPERYGAYLRALGIVVPACSWEFMCEAMPADFVHEDVLDLISARDGDAFESALRNKSRFGEHIE